MDQAIEREEIWEMTQNLQDMQGDAQEVDLMDTEVEFGCTEVPVGLR